MQAVVDAATPDPGEDSDIDAPVHVSARACLFLHNVSNSGRLAAVFLTIVLNIYCAQDVLQLDKTPCLLQAKAWHWKGVCTGNRLGSLQQDTVWEAFLLGL